MIKMYVTNSEWYEQNMIIYKYVISITLFSDPPSVKPIPVG